MNIHNKCENHITWPFLRSSILMFFLVVAAMLSGCGDGEEETKEQDNFDQISEGVPTHTDPPDSLIWIPDFTEPVTVGIEYLESTPILNGKIGIGHYFNDLVIEGPNIRKVSCWPVHHDPGRFELEWASDRIKMTIHRNPVIEMEYLGFFYKLEILGKVGDFTARISRLETRSMGLLTFEEGRNYRDTP